jgi:hypothetical protein
VKLLKQIGGMLSDEGAVKKVLNIIETEIPQQDNKNSIR